MSNPASAACNPDIRQWWQVFDDPVLDRLIAEADAHNSDLKIAGLRVMEARAQLGIAQSGRYPQLQQASADSLYFNRRQSGGSNPQDSHFWQHSAGFDIGWELDFWGRFSRAIESSDASYFAAQANYEDVLVLLRAQVADTYFALRTTEARLRVARENAKQQKRNFEITEKLFNSGQQAELDLQQAKTQYLGTLSTIPDFEDQVLRTRNALAVLIGQPPGALPQLLENEGLIPLVDRAVLQDVPANLLLRRPDVRAAELQCRRPVGADRRGRNRFLPVADLARQHRLVGRHAERHVQQPGPDRRPQPALEPVRPRPDQQQRARAGCAVAAADRGLPRQGAPGGARGR